MKTKIVATIGKKTLSYDILKKMKDYGMNIARINTKYGNEKQWDEMVKILSALNVSIMIDIKNLLFIDWINKNKIDYVAVSYAQDPKYIEKVRSLINDKSVKIISKIETKKGLKNVNKLIKSSDGIMVARGDLSRNIPFEKVPYYKKMIIYKCKKEKKFVIIATEMLLSMVNSKKPTNAEVEDVFSAVYEGGDALMLSEETAIGKYPALCVKTMRKIISYAERLPSKNTNKVY